MKYISTRGKAPILGFQDIVMEGLALDGGLYLPEKFPKIPHRSIRALRGKSYKEIAKAVVWAFIENEIEYSDFEKIVDESYSTFHHAAVCPLVQIAPNEFILELFHGPTLAFKDIAMQFLARLMDHILQKKRTKATIIGATSGDTGGAAIEAFANRANSTLFILFPKGRISPIQQRQITGNHAKNVHAMGIEGNFDDCQVLVKSMFNDHNFRRKSALAGVNSINWARIMAQTVYYFSAAISLGSPEKSVSFSVPTGNFGDIFAGFIASRMGLPIAQLIIANNENDILTRMLQSGIYEPRNIIYTTSPSIDIQMPSNLERLLFEIGDRDTAFIRHTIATLETNGSFTLDKNKHTEITKLFSAGRSSMNETAETIKTVFSTSGYLADPHTAIAIKVGREHIDSSTPMVILATAHPAKFPQTVKEACGNNPQLPPWARIPITERFEVYKKDEERIKAAILAYSGIQK